MSWQEMIENLQTVALPDGTQLGMLSACAICDLQGNLWGQSEGFPGIATDEAQKLMELFADPFSHCANGIYIGGTKVYYVSYLFFFASSSSSSGSTSVVFLFLNFSQKKNTHKNSFCFTKQYVYLNGSDEDGGVVRGKRGTEYGLVVKKCKTCFVIGIHGNNLETRQCSAHVEGFGEYLVGQGM
jgi:hypothetical protein